MGSYLSVLDPPLPRYGLAYNGTAYGVQVSILAHDGSVQVAHGGTEIGQGINQKVIQATAYALGIPVDAVTIEPTDSFSTANSISTGGSVTR